MLARRLFPGGVEVCERSLDQAIRTTSEYFVDQPVPAIFEGVFEHGGVLVRVDILHRRRDGRWRLIEVKSTSDLKDHHIEDVANPISSSYALRSRSGDRMLWGTLTGITSIRAAKSTRDDSFAFVI